MAEGGLGGRDLDVRVYGLHGPRLGLVSGDGPGAVGVYVPDLLSVEAGVLYGELHGAGDAASFRIRVGYVVGVGRAADAGHLRVGLDPAAFDGLSALQDHHRRALPDHETVVIYVVGPTRSFGVVVAAAHGPHGDETSDYHR